jgi:hypothetical protein
MGTIGSHSHIQISSFFPVTGLSAPTGQNFSPTALQDLTIAQERLLVGVYLASAVVRVVSRILRIGRVVVVKRTLEYLKSYIVSGKADR